MPNTFTKIASISVGSGGISDLDFTSIPSTYTDLQLCLSIRTLSATYQIDQIKLRFNGSATAVYNYRDLTASSAGASSGGAASQDYMFFGNAPRPQATASTFNNTSLYISNYASSNNKSTSSDSVAVSNGSGDYWYLRLSPGLWANTSAINRITVYSGDSGGFAQYSEADLYGIKNS
jgi:hypothetical protein